MSTDHTGNVQPQIDNEEHTHISGVAGKKVFNVDSSGNVLNFSAITVYQGGTWNSLVTVNNVLNSFSTILNSQTTVASFGNKGLIQQDTSTWAVNIIDYAHHEVHSGSHFYLKNWVDIPASTAVDFLFITPDSTKYPHVKWELASEAEGTMTLFENPVVSANGSGVTVYNNNRNSTEVSTIQAYSTPSLASTGQPIYVAKLGSGRTIGGGAGREHEMIAKRNTKYLVRLANDDGTATRWFGYDFYWYEHIDKV